MVTGELRRKRDLARTRERIMKAALVEFAAKGFAGARTDAIARRARVNKRMLFHCFGSKAGLYSETLRRKLAERAALLKAAPKGLSRWLQYWHETVIADPAWVRFLQWEALGRRHRLMATDERRELSTSALRLLDGWLGSGELSAGVDKGQLLLSVMAIAIFPAAFPQLSLLITGMWPEDKSFRQARLKFFDWLAQRLREPTLPHAEDPFPIPKGAD